MPSFSPARMRRTRGSEGVDCAMDVERARSRALMMIRSGTIEASWLSRVVSWVSFRERASAGPIWVPGVTIHSMWKSCKKRAHHAC